MSKTITIPGTEKMEIAAFQKLQGEQFGGGKNYVELEVGAMAGPFKHVKTEKVQLTKDSDPIENMYVALSPETGEETRMPASAIFRRNADDAKLKKGDEYYIYRSEDAKKKAGKGRGREMSVYLVKVTKRAKK